MLAIRSYSRQAGFSFVDLWGGLIIRLSEDNHHTALITSACRSIFATLQSDDFDDLTTDYGSGTPIPQFWVLSTGDITVANPGNAAVSGTITFFPDESSIPASFAALGSSYDLNNNGSIDGVVTDYRILPTRITLTTNSPDPRTVTVESILYARRSW